MVKVGNVFEQLNNFEKSYDSRQEIGSLDNIANFKDRIVGNKSQY